MRTRPVRIDQVIPSIVERDAVSHHTLEAQRVLHSMGFVSEIYACSMGPGLAGRVHPLSQLPREEPERQWVCYQASIGSPAADAVISHPGLKLVDYHNISPSELIERWMPQLADEVRVGRRQLAELAPVVELAFADSEFNRAELEAAGYRNTMVAPLMVDTANFYSPPDPQVGRRLEAVRALGGHDWLFVGQMLPHKAHHDVIKALACARNLFDPKARLHLVGRESCASYADALRRFVSALELTAAVEFVGSISPGELSAYYTSVDVLVCCSDHEGFCVPLLEAMHHRLPVVAYGVAAVPETLLDAGIVLPSKSPVLVAAAVERVLTDHDLHDSLVSAGLRRTRSFTVEGARRAFARAIEQALQAA
ncbi:MAG: glycosyltransferase family 4 protein [Acidimicrobiales bacterium]|jgi:glycosyltransferase involved in cell wall biosynthesis